MKGSATIGGIAGAIALTLVNEGARRVRPSDAPRLDLLGENALAKLMKGNSFVPQTLNKFFPLAGDLVSNSLFYSMAKGKDKNNTLLRGALLGLAAGVGAVTLPKPLGLSERHTTRTPQTTLMSIGWYIIGGIVASAVINALDREVQVPKDKELKDGLKSAGKEVSKRVAETV